MQDTVPQLDPARLTDVLRQAMRSATVALDTWRIQPVDYMNLSPANRALYRVSGTGTDRGTTVTWSLILKAFKAPAASSDDPSQLFYWKREPLAYQSDLLPNLSAGLAAPATFGISEQPDRQIWLWLEDLGTADETPWPLSRYELAAATWVSSAASTLWIAAPRPCPGLAEE